MNLAINGFGRIGRQALRIVLEKHPDMKVVLINDLTDGPTLAHLFEFDSTYGRFRGNASHTKDKLKIEGYGEILLTAQKDPALLPHKDMKVDVVLECTGFFTGREAAAAHLKAGARKVIISAPCKDKADGTFCIGVNHETYDPKTMHVISNASCTTNCLAPMAKVLHESFGIEYGLMNTIHSYTNDQNLLDLPHKDLRRARAAAANIIPTKTGAAKAVGLVLPQLVGKVDGFALRVPTINVSLVDLTFTAERATTNQRKMIFLTISIFICWYVFLSYYKLILFNEIWYAENTISFFNNIPIIIVDDLHIIVFVNYVVLFGGHFVWSKLTEFIH
jgi:glyceraldehyde 3-phosphate dehydrogenase